MEKQKKILFAIVLTVIAGSSLALKARVNHVIYTTDPFRTSVCNVPLYAKSMIPTGIGVFSCTAVPNQPCVPAITFDIDSN